MNFKNSFDKKRNSQTINHSFEESVDVSRRRFLATSAAGIVGFGAVGRATATPDEHTLVINGTGSPTTYSFTVGDNLKKSTVDGATIDDDDTIVEQSAHGTVYGGRDAYTFTGPLYSFKFDDSNTIDVTLDGEAAHVGQRPNHTLVIEGTGPNTGYSFATNGLIKKNDAHGASKNPLDKVNAYGAAGAVGSGKDAYTIDGELQAFEFDQNGALEVTIDGKSAHVGQLPDRAMTLFTEREHQDAEYEVTVSGSIREMVWEGQGRGNRPVEEKTIAGWVWGASYDKFTFDGEVVSFDTNNPDVLEAYIHDEKIY